MPGGAKGQINYFFRTRSWEKLNMPAGAFDAIRVDVLMMLDDATAFRNSTNCNFTYWYSPAVRNTVRERRTAQYTQLDQEAEYRVLDAFYELASFTPGKTERWPAGIREVRHDTEPDPRGALLPRPCAGRGGP